MSKQVNHGYKYIVIKNKATGRVENIKSNYTWSGSKSKEIKYIKEEWKNSDYKVLSVSLS